MYRDIAKEDHSLRPYQQKAKEDIFSAWDEYDSVMFQMPTGTGKTRLFTSIISNIKTWGVLHQHSPRILIIAHRVELIEQISESLNRYKVAHGIIAGGKERDLGPEVQVASIQTITHRTNIDLAESLNVDFVIIDEAHHSTSNSYRKLWTLYPKAKKLGVTATPWRMNHMGFSKLYGHIIVSKSIKEFIAEGWLAPYLYYSIKDNSSLHQDIKSINEFDIEGDYKISALEQVMDQKKIRSNLLHSYQKFASGKKGIIYSISRKHSNHICEEFKAAGINIVRIDSETPKEERRIYVQRFKNGNIDIIVNVDIFSEGFDCPDIEFIQLARPTKSLVKYLQQVGRGLRPTVEKSRCIILDNVGAHLEFGFPDGEREWEKEFIGETPKTSTKRNAASSTRLTSSETTFSEGNEELGLIQEIGETEANNITDTPKVNWNEKDDLLLSTLYSERNCPISTIAEVFKIEEHYVEDRLKFLDLYND